MNKIHEYISKDNPVAAQKVVEGIYEKVQILKTYPEIGQKYREESEIEIRIILHGHYRIAYIIKNDIIEILGIFHGAMNIEDYIK